MNCKRLLLLYAAVLILSAAFYVPDSAEAKQQEHGILIVYSTLDGKESADVKILDLIAGHFSSRVAVIKDADVKASRNKRPRHLLRTNEKKAEQKARAADQLLQKTCDSDRL